MKEDERIVFARFLFVYVNKYIINIFPVVTNMTKMEYNNSQKGQTTLLNISQSIHGFYRGNLYN